MIRNSEGRSNVRFTALLAAGFVVVLLVGVGLVYLGVRLSNEPISTEEARMPATALPTAEGSLPTAAVSPIAPTSPLPTATPEPTAAPPTATPAPAQVVVGAGGVNVRNGPGTNFSLVGSADPGSAAPLIGRYGDWWQIQYNGSPGWVYGELVTAENADAVPQVVPTASPTPAPVVPTATPAPTAVPPTAVPEDVRGIVARDFQVEGAPGPYAAGQEIWFNMWINNTSGKPVKIHGWGALVEQTGQFQKSFGAYSELPAGLYEWRDHINISSPGTYTLWMAVEFREPAGGARLGNPVTVIVQ
jgi:hypothetical protein